MNKTESRGYFHLTTKANLAGIARDGLVPQVGFRSQSRSDDRKAVFLYGRLADTWNWQHMLFGGEKYCAPGSAVPFEDLAVLYIETSKDVFADEKVVGTGLSCYYTTKPIKPYEIRVVDVIYSPKHNVYFRVDTHSSDIQGYSGHKAIEFQTKYQTLFHLGYSGELQFSTRPITSFRLKVDKKVLRQADETALQKI